MKINSSMFRLPIELLIVLILITTVTVLPSQCNYLLVFLIVSGILLGIYYGLNDYRIFHYPHTDEFYKDYLPKRKNGFTKVPPLNTHSKANNLWVHIVCGVTGSIALYLLLSRISLNQPLKAILRLDWSDFFLFLIAILGYTGLLPRTLWFFASSGGLGDFIKPKKN